MLSCPQLDDTCVITDDSSTLQDPGSIPVTTALRLGAAAALFLEGLIGVYVPVLLKTVEGYEW